MQRDQKYPYLLILKGKHGNDYFHITRREDVVEALGKIFDINDANDYYGDESSREYYEAEIGYKEEGIANIEKLGEAALKELPELVERLKSHKRAIAQAKAYVAEIDTAIRIRNGENELKAKFVWNRRDHEYEGIEQEYYS